MAYFICLLVVAGSIVFGVGVSVLGPGGLILLVDIPSAVIVVVPALVFSIAVTSWDTFTQSWKLVFSNAESSPEEVREVCALLNAFGNVAVMMGIIGTLIGLILMLADLSDLKSIGPNMSVALLTTYYGTVLKLLFYAAERRVNQRLSTSE